MYIPLAFFALACFGSQYNYENNELELYFFCVGYYNITRIRSLLEFTTQPISHCTVKLILHNPCIVLSLKYMFCSYKSCIERQRGLPHNVYSCSDMKCIINKTLFSDFFTLSNNTHNNNFCSRIYDLFV